MMRLPKARWWIGALAAAGVALGFVPWTVSRPVQGWMDRSLRQPGWRLTVDEARWVPWAGLVLSDLKIQSPRGGRVHLVRAHGVLRGSSLWKGRLVTAWDLDEIRMDPSSWGIHRPLAQEILSAGPVTTQGSALLEWSRNELRVERLRLDGPLLRVQAEGWVRGPQQAHLALQGALARSVLEGMRLASAEEGAAPWESFEMKLDGGFPKPEFHFRSNFLTLVLNSPLERTS